MDERNINEREGLEIISQMIRVARDDHYENGDGWLVWGWLLFAASLLSAVFSHLQWYRFIGWTWTGMLVIGMTVYLAGHVRHRRNMRTKTYVQDLMDKIGTGFFISLFIMIAAANFAGNHNFAFGYYYILYAFWMYIHGSALHFRPLIVGAFVNWCAAVAIFLITDFRIDMLVSAAAVMAGYLIPGYLLMVQHKKQIRHQVENGV